MERKVVAMLSKLTGGSLQGAPLYYGAGMMSGSAMGYPVDAPDMVRPTAPEELDNVVVTPSFGYYANAYPDRRIAAASAATMDQPMYKYRKTQEQTGIPRYRQPRQQPPYQQQQQQQQQQQRQNNVPPC